MIADSIAECIDSLNAAIDVAEDEARAGNSTTVRAQAWIDRLDRIHSGEPHPGWAETFLEGASDPHAEFLNDAMRDEDRP